MTPSKVKDGNFITIQSFMVKDLKLKGNELLTYAIIYGFSQDGENKFTGSLQYLCDWTNSTKQGISKTLKILVEKGLIEKTDIYKNGVKFVEYHVTEFNPMQQSLTGYATKFNEGMQQSLTGGMQQSLPNNISLNNINNNIKENKEKYFNNDTLNALFTEFLEMRKKLKAVNSDRAIKMLINKLNKHDDNTKIKMLENSILNSWKDVYELKGTNNQVNNKNASTGEFDGVAEAIRQRAVAEQKDDDYYKNLNF